MKTFLVEWTIKGSYRVTSGELGLEEDTLDAAKAVIDDDPLTGVDTDEGKLTYEVTEVL